MCVWQSHAFSGTSKLTGVAGWDALEKLVRVRMMAPAVIAPISASRHVSIMCSFCCHGGGPTYGHTF
jgi:hypothetical protein